MTRLRRFRFCGVPVAALLLVGCATSPAPVVDRSIGGSEAAVASAATPTAPASGSYRVQGGDTLYSIAFRHGLDYRELARWNGIAAPYTIRPGESLRLTAPVGERVAASAPAPRSPPTAEAAGVPTPVGVFEPVPETPRTADAPAPSAPPPVAPERPAAAAPGVAQSAAAAAPTAAAAAPTGARSIDGVAWRWPADGALLSRFQGGDPTRQGIDIAGKSGDPVRSAADGTVVYSGNGLIGYGELIIVKHSDSFLSAYGHNRRRLVKEGDRVAAGQQIAEMGASGAPRDELHFEVRRDGKPVDPLDYLPPR